MFLIFKKKMFVLKQSPYPCFIISELSKKIYTMGKHIPNKEFYCGHCQKKYSKKQNWEEHFE